MLPWRNKVSVSLPDSHILINSGILLVFQKENLFHNQKSHSTEFIKPNYTIIDPRIKLLAQHGITNQVVHQQSRKHHQTNLTT